MVIMVTMVTVVTVVTVVIMITVVIVVTVVAVYLHRCLLSTVFSGNRFTYGLILTIKPLFYPPCLFSLEYQLLS